ncbi:MAG: CPBP family intramembrane metalloprotease [Deltaproteobacteria bacterium]|nr:CPBP family intramembrane metalloprotease [Deltaproteobacteria bacterium]
MAENSANTYQLLPEHKRFQALLLLYLSPYLVYVSLSSIPEPVLSTDVVQGLKLLATGAVLLWFGKHYRFGPLKAIHGFIALLALPVALLCWVGPFYGLAAVGITDVMAAGDQKSFSSLYFCLRLVNSVILVAILEELFLRVYVMGWLHQAGLQRREKGLVGSILDTLEQRPAALTTLPLSTFAVVGATLSFTAGHQTDEYLSAVLYFLFTTWLYKKTGSLWVCILIHGLTNLSIALMVRYAGMAWLW